jgi:DNA-binding GntR family transcriptional regulator
MRKTVKRSDQAYFAIKERILSGKFPPGTRMLEENLSALVGFSRTPVRDALRRLETDGIIEYERHHGLVVSGFATEDVEDLFDLRVILESYGAYRAAQRCTSGDIEQLSHLANEMTRILESGPGKEALQEITRLNNQFHSLVATSSGNMRYVKMLSGLVEVGIVLRTYSRYGAKELKRSMQGHHELVDTFRARDPEWARSVMSAHLLTAKHAFLGLVEPGKEEKKRRGRRPRNAVNKTGKREHT